MRKFRSLSLWSHQTSKIGICQSRLSGKWYVLFFQTCTTLSIIRCWPPGELSFQSPLACGNSCHSLRSVFSSERCLPCISVSRDSGFSLEISKFIKTIYANGKIQGRFFNSPFLVDPMHLNSGFWKTYLNFWSPVPKSNKNGKISNLKGRKSPRSPEQIILFLCQLYLTWTTLATLPTLMRQQVSYEISLVNGNLSWFLPNVPLLEH